MPRARKVNYRQIAPDPIYNHPKVAKLINRVMQHGKKSLAQHQVYSALDLVKNTSHQDPLRVFETALQNITPQMEVRSRRVGGAAYQVPTPVKTRRGFSLAVRWLVVEARSRPNGKYHNFSEKLAAELLAAAQGEGGAINRKLNSHRQAEANKAFAHFRW